MPHALVTIIAPLALERVAQAEAAIDKLRNPADDVIKNSLDIAVDADGSGTHFASLHAIRSQDGRRAYLAFEFSADGSEDAALERIAKAIGTELKPVFELATDWKGRELGAYLRKRRVSVGGGWFSNPGVVFAGTPGMTVGRIRRENALAARVSELVGSQPQADIDALARVEAMRAELAKDPKNDWARQPAEPSTPFEQPPLFNFILGLAFAFAKTYLGLLGLLLLAAAVFAARGTSGVWFWHAAFWPDFVVVFLVALLVLLIIAALVFRRFRLAEASDSLEERLPPREALAGMFERENQPGYAQNHMISVTQRKPGAIRWFTSRLVFWVVAQFAGKYYRPGFLSDIGTIHFARWVTAPGSPDILFFSNYGGSWESYLEDFITRAHAGLTAIWSNSIGFPRSENLFQRGATDGERFKRYARQSMVPTRFWYSAYPALTTAIIRNNAEIRRGLSGSMTEDEAIRWLALFGSSARPAPKLLSSEIQSLVFGGLGFLPHGTCLLFELPKDVPTARNWLKDVQPRIAYNDGRRLLGKGAAVTLALTANGLRRLGLPEEGLATFPFAFLDGMRSRSRARILGDDPSGEDWSWELQNPDAVLLVYGKTKRDVARLERDLIAAANSSGMKHERIPLKEVTDDKREAFGFIDGISQPVIRGTYKGLRNADPIHLVEPGEFILGYPDNRNNIPPGPTLPATSDPDNRLPLVGGAGGFTKTVVENDRDLGFNGSFLVIRQLEQDVSGFDTYCETEAKRLTGRLPPPHEMTSDFVAAKLIGRWRDGSSLARFPYESRSLSSNTHDMKRARTSNDAAVEPPPTTAGAAGAMKTMMAAVKEDSVKSTRKASAGKKPKRRQVADNDFLFGTEDPEALRCPFGAHVRRSNPRDSFDPGSADQIAISNRHRILRVGRQYEAGGKRGLLFMCLNGDIERQFEFVQQTWLMSPSFHGLSCEKDPVLGDGETGACGFTIPSRFGPLKLSPMPRFVSTKGGGYFFMPGKRLIEYLSTP